MGHRRGHRSIHRRGGGSMTARPERVLVLGCGSVAQCTVPLLVRDLGIEAHRVRIVDFVDNRARVADLIAQGVTYEQDRVTRENLDEFLSARVGPGDLLLDLAWNIDNPTIVQWCRDHGVRYLNTSVEVWDPYDHMQAVHPLDRTLYVRHMELRKMMARWGTQRWPDRGGRTRRQPRPRQPLHQAGAHRDRDPDPFGGQGGRPSGRPRAGPRREPVQRARHAHRYQGDPHRRARHPDHEPAQGDQRVRQHLVGRRFLRGRRGARRARLGDAREAAPRWGLRAHRLRSAQPDLHRQARHGDLGAFLGAVRRDAAAW